MKRIEIDAAKLEERESAHAYLKELLSLPAWYGSNLDALYDCLGDMRETLLVVKGAEKAGETAKRFLRVFEDAAEENRHLKLKRAGSGCYQLIALDMDGTALRDDKTMDDVTREVIRHALKKGKQVVFCTGRPVAEMRYLLKDFPEMNYLLCESGALLYDLKEEKGIYRKCIPDEAAQALRITAAGRDVCPVVFSAGEYYISSRHVHHMAHYQMGQFQEFVLEIANIVDDVFAHMEREGMQGDKINLFHPSPQERALSRRILQEKCPEQMKMMTMADTEVASLECTPLGVDKGFGLRALSEVTGIPLEQMIMVGDGDNDLEGLETAGLAVAVANANDHVRSICDAVVADNEHWGCAEAIMRYLMGIF